MTTIALDLDEVLAETTDAFLSYYKHTINGIHLTKEQITTYGFQGIPWLTISPEQLADHFLSFFETSWSTISPIEGAHDKLQQRKGEWHTLYVVTARNQHLVSSTLPWIENHFPHLIEEVYFANHDNDSAIPKSSLCHQVGATIMIEDHLDYALELHENGIQTYLLEKPRNRQFDPAVHAGITKVTDWASIDLDIR